MNVSKTNTYLYNIWHHTRSNVFRLKLRDRSSLCAVCTHELGCLMSNSPQSAVSVSDLKCFTWIHLDGPVRHRHGKCLITSDVRLTSPVQHIHYYYALSLTFWLVLVYLFSLILCSRSPVLWCVHGSWCEAVCVLLDCLSMTKIISSLF